MRLLLLFLVPALAFGQSKNVFVNVQLHRDFHREAFTSTIEIFELDRLGTSFFFTDFDYHSAGQTGSYFEVSRNFAVRRGRLFTSNLSLQFNDGVLNIDALLPHKDIPRTVLYGVALSNISIATAYVELQGLVRQEFGASPGLQFTGVWSLPISGTPLFFQGYIDWFNHYYGRQPTVVQSEPQLLVRSGQWAVGTELEISRNFSGAFTESNGFRYRTWYTHPTVFVRLDL